MNIGLKFASLFGGIGGFDLPLVRRGHECVFYNDNDKYAVKTYNKNFKTNYEPKDVRTIKASDIPDFDLLVAGFPCQAFSIAGKRRGFKDTRGTLFFEICRIVEVKRPKLILLENVKGLLNHEKGKTYQIIIQALEELGYDLQWMVLNSKFFGVPQNRERVFIIGNLRETSRSEVLPFTTNAGKVQEIHEGKAFAVKGDVVSRKNPERQKGVSDEMFALRGAVNHCVYHQHRAEEWREFENMSPCLTSHGNSTGGNTVPMVRAGVVRRGEFGNGIKEDCSFTMDRTCGRDLLVGGLRRLTPVECERLQGFPDNWTQGVSDTQRYKQLGNAVTVSVVESIVEKLIDI